MTLRARGRFFYELADAGIPTSCMEMSSRHDLMGIARAIRAGCAWHPDLLLTHETNGHVIGRAVAMIEGVPQIVVDHSGAGGIQRRRWHRRNLTGRVARRSTLAISLNSSQSHELVAGGFPPDRIRHIPNGVPEPAITTDPVELREELGVGTDGFLALLVATLRPEKRPRFFVESVMLANAENRQIRGVIAGGGPELAATRAVSAAACGVVTVLGERSDVGSLMAAADVICLTSRSEGMPMALLEAMASRRAVLTTEFAGVADIVQDGVSGIVVRGDSPQAFADALLALSRDRRMTSELSTAGRARYENQYTVDQMADRYAEVLYEVLETWHPHGG